MSSKNRILCLSGLGWMFDAMDVGLLSFLLVIIAQEWALPPSDLGLVGSINAIGMAVGALFFGMLSDRIGRKAVFMWTLLLFSVASGLSALATGFTSFLVLRFLLGMGLGGELPVAATYVSEVMPAHERGRAVVLLESFWAVGWILAALLAYFVMPHIGWRGVLGLCALPAFYTLYLRKALPEDLPMPIKSTSSFKTFCTLWNATYRQSTFVLWTLWFVVVFSYYGMFLWLPSVMVKQGFPVIQSFGYVLLMSLAQLPGYFTVAYWIERIGRKKVLALFLLGTAGSAFAFAISETLSQLLLSGALLSFFNLGAWGALYAYTPEQYPAHIRGGGAGAAASFGRIGGILGPMILPWIGAAGGNTMSVFTLFAASIFTAVLVLLFLGTETLVR